MPGASSAGGSSSDSTVGNGRILRMRLKNFLIHKDVELRPGLHLNLIIGPNGSGKSTIVSAMCLGLGGSPKVLDRQKQIDAFIKHGETKATIEIELQKNPGTVTIKRKIESGGRGKTTWYIDNKECPEKNVKKLTKSLNIQIENLCQFVPQERVSAFADMKPDELLKATEEAAGGDELVAEHDALIDLGEEKKEKKDNQENYTKDLEQQEARFEAGEADYKRWEDRKAQEKNMQTLEKKLPWLLYERDRVAHEAAKEALTKCKEKLEAAHRVGGDAEKEHAEAKRLRAEKNEETRLHGKEMHKKLKTVTRHHEQIEKHKEDVEELTKQIEGISKRGAKIQKKERQVNNGIEENETLLANTKSDELTPKLKKVNTKINELKARIHDVEKQKRIVVEEKKETGEKVKRNAKNIQAQTNFKAQAKKKLFQRDRTRNIENACEWLDANRDEFTGQVFDAIALHIDMKSRPDAKKIENLIPAADMQAMLTQNGEDHSKLLSKMESNRIKVTAVKDPHPAKTRQPRFKIDQLKQYGFTCVASDLFNAPDSVMRYLLHTHNLHNVPIGPADTKKYAEELLEKYNIGRFIAGDSLIQVMKSDYGKRHISVKDSILKDAYYLGGASTDEGQVKILKEDQKRYQADMMDMETKEKELNVAYTELRQEFDRETAAKLKLKKMHDAIFQAGQKIKRYKEDLKAIEKQTIDLERERVNYKKRLDSKGGASVQEILKLKGLVKEVIALSTTHVVLKLEEHDLTVKERIKKLLWEDQNAELDELNQALDKAKADRKAKKAVAHEALKVARHAIGANEPDARLLEGFDILPETIELVEDAIREEQAKLDIVAEVDEDAIEEHKRLGKEIAKMKKSQAKFEEEYAKLCENIETKKAEWAPKIRGFVKTISEGFSEAFERLTCTGEVRLREDEDDFKLWGIEIWVRFRGAQKLHILEGTVQSGGEKSVSTMLYLMSIQSLTKCPFRVVDEINQGMDAKNERMIYGQVFHASENTATSQYFIITPKLLPNLEYRPTMRVLCVVNGPYVQDADKMQMPSTHKRAKLEEMIHLKAKAADRLTTPRNRDA